MSDDCCVFPGAIGLNRILTTQSFRKEAPQDDSACYSWPVPQPDGKSCNVVLLGEPGTGKTRLALELSARLRTGANGANKPCSVLYYSLEQKPAVLCQAMKDLTSEMKDPIKDKKMQVECKVGPQAGTRPEKKGGSGNIVWFPTLSPRRLEQTGGQSDADSVFWRRYEEIRLLLNTFDGVEPELRMVVIDSLNVFGDKPVSRYMIEQLFALFHENGLVGMCIAEDPESVPERGAEEPHVSSKIANLADVVIKLGWSKDYGYQYRRIEVAKSRNTANAYGSHCMKIANNGIQVFPSLHCCYTFLTREKEPPTPRFSTVSRTSFGGNWVESLVIPGAVCDDLPSIVNTIVGPMDTDKSKLALSYGLVANKDRLKGNLSENGRFLIVSFDVSGSLSERAASLGEFGLVDGAAVTDFDIGPTKGSFKEVKKGGNVCGYQLWFAPGYLLAEEMVHFISQALITKTDIARVVFLDIGQIPSRHPALAQQMEQHAAPFVVLVELFRHVGVDACFVCTSPKEDPTSPGPEGLMASLGTMLARISHGTVKCQLSDRGEVLVSYSGRFALTGGKQWVLTFYTEGELSLTPSRVNEATPRPLRGA